MQVYLFVDNRLPDRWIVVTSGSIQQTLSQTYQILSTLMFPTPLLPVRMLKISESPKITGPGRKEDELFV
jgi:hypothetical protein